jgi:hypothetical protein
MAAIGRIIARGAVIAGSFAALLVGLYGCSPSFNWEGTWKGDRAVRFVPGTSTDLQNSIKRVTLSINSGRFQLVASGIPSDGLFHSTGKSASLETINLLGRPADNSPAIHLKENADGTITMDSPDNFDRSPIVLHRESQPPTSNVRNR